MTRRSMTGFSILLGSNLVSWKTKKQATVSRSSAEAAEAEHWAMATLKSELQWLTYLLSDLGISPLISFDTCHTKKGIKISS